MELHFTKTAKQIVLNNNVKVFIVSKMAERSIRSLLLVGFNSHHKETFVVHKF